jgi:hypothetical protein
MKTYKNVLKIVRRKGDLMIIQVLEWVVLVRAVLSTLACLINVIVNEDSSNRLASLIVGFPLEVMTAIVAGYLIFIK